MRTTIQIDCDSGKELLSHLTVIRIQVKAMIEKAKKKDIKKPIKLDDNNCYGTHKVVIREFGVDDFIN